MAVYKVFWGWTAARLTLQLPQSHAVCSGNPQLRYRACCNYRYTTLYGPYIAFNYLYIPA